MKSSKLIVFCLLAGALVSCGPKAVIKGTVKDAPKDTVVVKLLDVNVYKTLDTLVTDASGRFVYKLAVAKGQPEFVYLFHGDTKIASLLLNCGDKVALTATTKGNYSVEGSEESVKLQQVERDFADFIAGFRETVGKASENASESEASEINRELSRQYVAYYRKAIAYISANNHSLTVVPVFYQKVNENFPIFSRRTDAILMSAICDSLKTVYPESRYVKALEKEAARRLKALDLENKLMDAEELGYPDINMPDIVGEKVSLRGLDAKVILVQFWAPEDQKQVLMNTEILKPVYEDYHSKGFEIFQVGVTVDKLQWAVVVRNQKLPWINVCDGLGPNSPALSFYNVGSLPMAYLISDGTMSAENVTDEASLRRYLNTKLK